jgi:hypothetical protein
MENLGDKVLEKIKKEKICLRPRWHFLLENYFIWFFFVVSLLVGSLAFCTILYIFFTNDWDLYKYLHTSFLGHVLISIPYIWFVILLFFIWIAYYNFKCTKSGYRHETFYVVGLSIVGSLLLGAFLNTLGLGETIENAVAASLPAYENLVCCGSRKDIWDQPEVGLLGGQIVQVDGKENFSLKDFNGVVWIVQEDDDTLEYEPVGINIGEEVKVIGEDQGSHVFWAREIRPWKNKGDARKARIRVNEKED